MSVNRRFIALGLAALISTPALAFAQPAPQPVSGVVVEIYRQGQGAPFRIVTTSAAGTVSATGLPAGKYTVSVRANKRPDLPAGTVLTVQVTNTTRNSGIQTAKPVTVGPNPQLVQLTTTNGYGPITLEYSNPSPFQQVSGSMFIRVVR